MPSLQAYCNKDGGRVDERWNSQASNVAEPMRLVQNRKPSSETAAREKLLDKTRSDDREEPEAEQKLA